MYTVCNRQWHTIRVEGSAYIEWRRRFCQKVFFPLYFDLLFSIIFEHSPEIPRTHTHPAIKGKVIFHLILDLCKSIIHVMNNYTFSFEFRCAHTGTHTHVHFIGSGSLAYLRFGVFLRSWCCFHVVSLFRLRKRFFLRFLLSHPFRRVYLFEIWIWLVFGIVFFFHSSIHSPLYSR